MAYFSRLSLLAAMLCATALSAAAQQTLSGAVYEDRNRNGRFDKGEPALCGIPVSDGDTIVMTDRKGRYLFHSSSETVFPVLPPDYSLARGGIRNLAFVRGEEGRTDFGLVRQRRAKRFRVAVVGDVHVEEPQQMAYAERTVMDALADGAGADFNIWLGDLANDSPEWLGPVAETVNALPRPSWVVMGNHDYDAKKASWNGFSKAFGAAVYAFRYGKYCFVALQNALGTYLPSDLRFVRNLSAMLPDDCTIVLCQHVPIEYTKGREEMTEILSARRSGSLILAAHMHTVYRIEPAPKIAELVVGSVCATWWRGVKDASWVPLSLQQCGSPRNFFTIDFGPDGYEFRYRAIGSDEQMRLWIAGTDPSDTEIEPLNTHKNGLVVLNVFAGGSDTAVAMSIDGGEAVPMSLAEIMDPAVARLRYQSESAGYQRRDPRRAVYRKTASPHLWSAQLPDSLTGVHLLTFTAKDSYGLDVKRSYMVVRR